MLRSPCRFALGTVVAILTTVSSARADFVVVGNSDPNALLGSLLGSTTGLSNFSATVTGDASAFGLFSGGLPAIGVPGGVVLSTGRAVDVVGPNNATNKSTDLPGSDSVLFRIAFDSDGSASNLFFRYVFGSEEFPEYGGSQFNDRFELLLNGENLAKLTNGQDVTINNLAASPTGPFNPDYISNTGGTQTQLDAYTKPLTLVGDLRPGANVLEISIRDVGDSIFDSAVFIEGSTLGTVTPPLVDPNPIPAPPAVVLGFIGAAGLVAARFRKAKLAKGEAMA